MKKGYTHIGIALDSSGSMESIRESTISNFNEFLKTQQDAPGEATFSLVTFADSVKQVNKFQPINVVQPLTKASYVPNGMTALNDGIGVLIDDIGKHLASLPESERPAGVIIAIITDGGENSSKDYSLAQIKEKIRHQTDQYQWEFVYFGANVNEQQEGTSRGFSSTNSMKFTASNIGTTKMYEDFSNFTLSYRSKH